MTDERLIAKALEVFKEARREEIRASVARTRATRKLRGGCIDCPDGKPESDRFSRCLACRRVRNSRLKKSA